MWRAINALSEFLHQKALHKARSDRQSRRLQDDEIILLSQADETSLLARLESSPMGLTEGESEERLRAYGGNAVSSGVAPALAAELIGRAFNPLNGLLVLLALVSFATGDARAALIIAAMVVLSVLTAFVQEHRSNAAAAKLRAMVKTTATVRRRVEPRAQEHTGKEDFVEVPVEHIVVGDIVRLSAGDMIPADLRLLTAHDLFINQSALTGESMPAERHAKAHVGGEKDPFEIPNLCFMGSNVVSGYGTGVVFKTGAGTYFGEIADTLAGQREETSFEHGVNRFTWLMIRFMFVMVPAVFIINGITKGNWLEALLFAVAVAVGLTPEMLPMIITVNLAKGALAMSSKHVIVKRLNAIQDFGAIDLLCTDKTGTLTQDRIILKRHLDLRGEESARVLEFAYLNSYFQSGLKNLLDVAVLKHVELEEHLKPEHQYKKIDEVPFDFTRRRLSVILEREDGRHILICKGAVEEIFSVATRYEIDGAAQSLDAGHFEVAKEETRLLNEDGFRVVAVAYKELTGDHNTYSVADERDLTLLGYIAFLDPPKDSAQDAILALHAAGLRVKILTGDNEVITRKVCHEVGLDVGRIVLGAEVEALSDEDLARTAENTIAFAKLTPQHKARVIKAMQTNGHVVGYLGDGINDSPALKAADVGISVDSAVDIAKESADIILLDKSLMVLRDGVIEGRKVFANIVKYIKMGASSNFGNMLSVLGASLFLPFLPMTPVQVLTNNLLYDLSQTPIPSDNVDEEYLAAPRRWDITTIERFMLTIGPISSIFDYVTYATLLYGFSAWTNPAIFQTGWFVESLLTQTLIIHIIRTAKIPFVQSRASASLIGVSIIVSLIGCLLPLTNVGGVLGFTPLPMAFWPVVAAIAGGYAVVTHVVKIWFVRRWGI